MITLLEVEEVRCSGWLSSEGSVVTVVSKLVKFSRTPDERLRLPRRVWIEIGTEIGTLRGCSDDGRGSGTEDDDDWIKRSSVDGDSISISRIESISILATDKVDGCWRLTRRGSFCADDGKCRERLAIVSSSSLTWSRSSCSSSSTYSSILYEGFAGSSIFSVIECRSTAVA